MTATTDICAPAEQTEGTRSQVLRWLKQVGDPVQQNEPLVEMETDKVTVEVAAPASGVLQAILKGEQEEISPGDVLGRIALPETSSSSVTAATESQAAESTHQNPPAAPVTAAEAVQSAAAGTPPRTRTRDSARTNLAPAVRRLLAEKGLDPSQVQGTGEGGRITVDDVLAFAAVAGKRSETAEERAARDASAEASSSALPSSQGIPSHYVPHSAVRKRIAEHMVQSLLHTAPHVTTVFEADLAAVSAHRARHKLEFEAKGVPLTFTSYFLAAAVEAIRVVPEANSRWTDSALEIYDAIHIGVATALEGIGLVVPVMRNVDHKDLFGIATALNDVVSRKSATGGSARRHVHALQSRCERKPPRRAHRDQSTAIRHSRRRQAGEAPGGRDRRWRGAHRDSPQVLRHADDRSPGDGWASGQPLHAHVRQRARGLARRLTRDPTQPRSGVFPHRAIFEARLSGPLRDPLARARARRTYPSRRTASPSRGAPLQPAHRHAVPPVLSDPRFLSASRRVTR
jgi:2-oxoglutarate dehydrogenase E2 component (dihydrolipoamide succinyltransferase)